MAENTRPDYREVGNIFFHDGYELARKCIPEGFNRDAIVDLMHSAYESIDGLMDSFRNRCRLEGLRVDCRNGCSWCCKQAVLVSNHEILAIEEYLNKNYAEDTIHGIKVRTSQKHQVTAGMTAMEFLHYSHPCPLLENNSCLVYPARPMACRCYLSSSEKSCLDQHDYPEDRARVAALYNFPLQAGRYLNEGIRTALVEKGLISVEWLLENFLYAVFENPGIMHSWIMGNNPFHIRCLSPEESRYLREYNDS